MQAEKEGGYLVRRLRGEQSRITVRLPAAERRAAEKVARQKGRGLSDFVREAIREKVQREGRDQDPG